MAESLYKQIKSHYRLYRHNPNFRPGIDWYHTAVKLEPHKWVRKLNAASVKSEKYWNDTDRTWSNRYKQYMPSNADKMRLTSWIGDAIGALAYTAITIYKGKITTDNVKSAARIAASDDISSYSDEFRQKLLEKYPWVGDKVKELTGTDIQNLDGYQLEDGVDRVYHSIFTEVSKEQVVITPGAEGFFVDVRNNLISNFHDGVNSIIDAATNMPPMTELLTTPEAIAAFVLISSAVYLRYNGLKHIGKATLALDITARCLAQNTKNALGSGAKTK